jgi:hypothetical protein
MQHQQYHHRHHHHYRPYDRRRHHCNEHCGSLYDLHFTIFQGVVPPKRNILDFSGQSLKFN